jgi:hypothetical protein
MTTLQLKALHVAAGQLRKLRPDVFDDAWYRLVLVNVGNVRTMPGEKPSSKALTNAGFELVMAFMEESGFRDSRGEAYWRSRLPHGKASTRQVWQIHRLGNQQRYAIAGLCEQFSGGRTRHAEKLTPFEAVKLVEMLKQAVRRETIMGGSKKRDGQRESFEASSSACDADPTREASAPPPTTLRPP